jgi:ATP-dependent Clp protease ATP-binding subunit ClpC
MIDRLTDHARKALNIARQESKASKHDYLGSQHILLGSIAVGGVAWNVLKGLDVTLARVRREVVKLVPPGKGTDTHDQVPFSPDAKKLLELALNEAGSLGHEHVGTEHLLLGAVGNEDSVSARALSALRVDQPRLREAVRVWLAAHPREPEQQIPPLDHPGAKLPVELLRRTITSLTEHGEEEAARVLRGVLERWSLEQE